MGVNIISSGCRSSAVLRRNRAEWHRMHQPLLPTGRTELWQFFLLFFHEVGGSVCMGREYEEGGNDQAGVVLRPHMGSRLA